MPLPIFYTPHLAENASQILLDEPTSRHIVQVLRMPENEQIQLTNGKGWVALAKITHAHKKNTTAAILSGTRIAQAAGRKTGIAISPVKNNSRLEWFLEKATELGVADIYPIICHRTEKEHFRTDRLQAICISAMLQSQQAWLPNLHQPIGFEAFIKNNEAIAATYQHKWIAHCTATEKMPLANSLLPAQHNGLILIGPEGDFTVEEIELALQAGYLPAALGNTRLRTETAGIVAATLLRLVGIESAG